MKRSKKLYLLLAVLAAACAATVAVRQWEGHKEEIKTSGEIILSVPADSIDSVSWEQGDTALSFHKEEGWLYDGDKAFPVDEEKLTNLLAIFDSFGVSFVIEDVTDLSLYGLDEPEGSVTFTAGEKSYTMELGDYSKMDAERYVTLGDGKVYLAKQDPLDTFDVELSDLILHDQTFSYESVEEIRFEGAENYTIFYEEDSAAAEHEDDVYFLRRDGEVLPLDTSRVNSYLSTLTGLNLSDYVTYDATEEELGEYDLLSPELTVTVDYTGEDGKKGSFTLSISRDPEKLAAAGQAETDGEEPEEVTAYVRVGESKLVYRVSEYTSGKLRSVSYNDLRRREVLKTAFESLGRIDIVLEGFDYTLTIQGKDDERVWLFQEEEVDVDELQSALEGLRADSADKFVTGAEAGKEEIRLRLYPEGEEEPSVELVFSRHDGSDCLAAVDGKPFALVSRTDVVSLIEAVNKIVLG